MDGKKNGTSFNGVRKEKQRPIITTYIPRNDSGVFIFKKTFKPADLCV